MVLNPGQTHIAYRCPECATLIYGFVGKFALSAGMLRLKCSCGNSALDVSFTSDKKVRLSVPCIFCKQNHNYVVSQNLFFGRDIFLLNCPYSNMDICFIGEKEKTDEQAERTGKELERLLAELEAEDLKDIQPMDVDTAEAAPDPAIYDTLNFVVRDLEDAGKVSCPCQKGPYELRFTDTGMQLSCSGCGATYELYAMSGAGAETYLDITEIKLS